MNKIKDYNTWLDVVECLFQELNENFVNTNLSSTNPADFFFSIKQTQNIQLLSECSYSNK